MSLLPAKHTFTIWKSATFVKNLTLYNDAGISPRDLTGYAASMPIKDDVGTTLLTLATGGQGITLGTTNGLITLTILAAATGTLTWTHAHYELFITSPAPQTDIILYGNLKVAGF